MTENIGQIVEKIVGGYDWDRLTKDAKDSKIKILADYIEKGTTDNDKIVNFLNECEEQDYQLDSDDLTEILKLNFDYIRNQYQDDEP